MPVQNCFNFFLKGGTQWVCEGFEGNSVRFQNRCVTGLKAHNEGRICTVANRFAIFGPRKTAVHLRC